MLTNFPGSFKQQRFTATGLLPRMPLSQGLHYRVYNSCSTSRCPGIYPELRPKGISQQRKLYCTAKKREVEYIQPPNSGKLESTAINSKIRQKQPGWSGNKEMQVVEATESLGGRVTVGDVAARAGVNVSEAEEALNALAADCLGTLQVSSSGEALYAFPQNFASTIRNRSLLLKLAPLLASATDTAAYLVRVSFGAALVTSVALVWITIFAILSSSNNNNDRDNRNRGGYYGGGYYGRRSSLIWWDASDMLWFSSRRIPRYEHSPKQQMSFLESIFSFVFGDGDPNVNYEEQRWQMVGRYIQSKGGVVTAEELAPYLDPPEKAKGDEVDESFVLPALVRFGGSPEVDAKGNLLYRFESLQSSGSGRSQAPSQPAALQNLWEQSKAVGGQRTAAVAFGVANLVGVGVLAGFLRQPSVVYSLYNSSLGFMIGLMPFLQGYAAAFFVIPAVRWLLNQQRNSGLQTANRIRLERLKELREPSPQLQQKLLSAQNLAHQKVIKDEDIIYRTDRNLDDQKDMDAEEFDRRLQDLDSTKDSGRRFDDWVAQPQADSEWKQTRR